MVLGFEVNGIEHVPPIQGNGTLKLPHCFCAGCRIWQGHSTSRDIIWTFIKGKDMWYDTNLMSIRSSGCRARIILVTDSKHRWNPHFSKVVQMTNTEVFTDELISYVHTDHLRLTWLQRWLTAHASEIDRVFAMDAFDVFFDSDPFQLFRPEDKDSMIFVEECEFIGNQRHNTIWCRTCWGEKTFQDIKEKRILNSGTVFGGIGAFIRYLNVVLNLADWKVCIWDQPRIAWLVYCGGLKKEGIKFRTLNHTGEVISLTVCPRHIKQIDGVGRVVHPDHSVPLIVHQWNRKAMMTELFFQRCPYAEKRQAW
jgi:hypothetical protein